LCPNIVLPKILAEFNDAIDECVKHSHPLNERKAVLVPLYSECRIDLNFKGKRISITCDAIAATILSLFETPETKVRRSYIEEETGVEGLLLSTVMEQLCMKRPNEGMATGLLEVPQSFDCVEFGCTHAPFLCAGRQRRRSVVLFPPKVSFTSNLMPSNRTPSLHHRTTNACVQV
jgi:hypothetical protein